MARLDRHKATSIACTAILAGYTFALAAQSLLLIEDEGLDYLKINLIMQMILVVLFGVWSYLKSGIYLNAPVIFIGAIYVWHSPFLTGHYLELAMIFEWTGRHLTYGEEYVPKATGLVALCLTSGVVGTLLGYYWQRGRVTLGESNAASLDVRSPLNSSAKRFLWMVFVGYGLLTLVFLLKEGVNTFSGDYMDLYTEHSDTVLYRVYQSTKFYFSIILLAVFAFVNTRREFWNALAISLVIIFIQFLLGSRSIPFINMIALVVAIDYFVRRLPIILLPISVLFMSAISFIIQSSRGGGVGFNVFNFVATGKEMDFLHFFWEMGGIIRNVIRTMSFMGNEGIVFGQTFFNSFVYLLPKFYLDAFGFQPSILRPSEWLIEHSADIPFGGGIGYSLVAEGYYNFGMPGCLLFLIIGWFISRNYFRYIRFNDIFSLLHSMNFVTILALHMRNDSEAYLRYIVYGALFIELLRYIGRRGIKL